MKTKKKHPISPKQAPKKPKKQHGDGNEPNSKAQTSSSTSSSSSSSVDQLPLAFPRHLSSRLPPNDFLRNNETSKECFQAALETSYLGLAIDAASSTSTHLREVLQGMHQNGYFQTDVTQPFGLGTKCAKTYVTRCLVGDFGTTYKYLGLRMFAHSWQPTTHGGASQNICHELQTFKDRVLVPHTKQHLQELHQKRRTHNIHYNVHRSRPEYNICLINRMDSSLAPQNYKVEPTFEKDKIAVAWHADSSLDHFSNIAVYQLLQRGGDENNDHSHSQNDEEDCWSLAMRTTPHAEGPHLQADPTRDPNIPPISLSLPSGSIYYMLDDFNHHHQHAVLCTANNHNNKTKDPKKKKQKSKTTADDAPINETGTTIRYSATYRLLRPSHTVQEVLDQCQSCCRTNFHKRGIKIWRSQQLLLSHIEFEWLRQFYIQGQHHYNMLWNNNWDVPIQQLWKYWQLLEHKTHGVISLLQMAAQGKCHTIAATTTATNSTNKITKAQRKLRDKQRKAFATVQELLSRSNHHQHNGKQQNQNSNNSLDTKIAAPKALESLYEPMAELLRERAATRQQWRKREQDYVFSTMPAQFRPLHWPVQYECHTINNDDDHKNNDSVTNTTNNDDGLTAMATSPLPGSPQQLLEIADQLVAFGMAFDSGNASDLPACVIVTDSAPIPAPAAAALNKDTKSTSHSPTTTLSTDTSTNATSGIASSTKHNSNSKKRKQDNATANNHPKKQQWQKKMKNNTRNAETDQKNQKKRRY